MLKRLTETSNIKDINFHALRHTYATRLFEQGVQAKIVQELLGHASIQITLDTYSHVLPSLKVNAIETISRMFDSRKLSTGDDGKDLFISIKNSSLSYSLSTKTI